MLRNLLIFFSLATIFAAGSAGAFLPWGELCKPGKGFEKITIRSFNGMLCNIAPIAKLAREKCKGIEKFEASKCAANADKVLGALTPAAKEEVDKQVKKIEEDPNINTIDDLKEAAKPGWTSAKPSTPRPEQPSITIGAHRVKEVLQEMKQELTKAQTQLTPAELEQQFQPVAGIIDDIQNAIPAPPPGQPPLPLPTRAKDKIRELKKKIREGEDKAKTPKGKNLLTVLTEALEKIRPAIEGDDNGKGEPW